MGYYKTAKICLNGHLISSNIENHSADYPFCTSCGSKTITICQNCQAPIHGYYHIKGVVSFEEPTVSAFCHNCGEPYPWTKTFLETAEDMVDMFDELSPEQKLQLKETFPDLIVETPKSKLAALQASKLINGFQSAGKDIFISMLKEKVIDSLFLLMHLN